MYSETEIERFGVADENGEIVVDRDKLLKDFVERGVCILKEIDTLKQDTKELLEGAESLNFDKSEVKLLIKYVYKNSITLEIEKLEEIQAKLDNMFD